MVPARYRRICEVSEADGWQKLPRTRAAGHLERVPDAAGSQQRVELLVGIEQRVLGAAADPQELHTIVDLPGVSEELLEVQSTRLR